MSGIHPLTTEDLPQSCLVSMFMSGIHH